MADLSDGLSSFRNMLAEAEGVGVFLTELRDRTFAPHDSFSVGEVFDVTEEKVKDFISDNGYFSSMQMIFPFRATPFIWMDIRRLCLR